MESRLHDRGWHQICVTTRHGKWRNTLINSAREKNANFLDKGALKIMKIITSLSLAALAIMLTSCTTPKPPQAFHNTDNTALIVEVFGWPDLPDAATHRLWQGG
jgi:hypothetical protein